MKERILYLHSNDGALQAVQIPSSLWRRLEPHLARISCPDEDQDNDMAGFEEFLAAWTFPYAYKPHVRCPGCNASCADWRNDPDRSFRLASADISGHLVFHCNGCGSTIRQKYFKDHMAEEFSPPASSVRGASK